MTEQELRQILIEIEGSTPPTDPSAILAGARRVLSRRRRRQRRIGAVAGAVLLAVGSVLVVNDQSEPKIARQQSENLQAELGEIRAEAARLREELKLLLLRERQAEVRRRAVDLASQGIPDDAQIESAAAALVYHADRLDDRDSARRLLREVAANFPETISGRSARQKLAQQDNEEG